MSLLLIQQLMNRIERLEDLARRLDRPTSESGVEVTWGETGLAIRGVPGTRRTVRLTAESPGSAIPAFYSWKDVRFNSEDPSYAQDVEGGLVGYYDGSGAGAARERNGNAGFTVGNTTGVLVEIEREGPVWVFDFPSAGGGGMVDGGTYTYSTLTVTYGHSTFTYSDGTLNLTNETVNLGGTTNVNITSDQLWSLSSSKTLTLTGGSSSVVNLEFPTINLNSVVFTVDVNSQFILFGTLDVCGPLKWCYYDFTMTTDLNNWTVPSTAKKVLIRIDPGGADRIITGMVPQFDGQVIFLLNIGSSGYRITLADNSVSSTAGNRFFLPSDIILESDEGQGFWYSPTPDTAWRLLDRSGSSATISDYFILCGDWAWCYDSTTLASITSSGTVDISTIKAPIIAFPFNSTVNLTGITRRRDGQRWTGRNTGSSTATIKHQDPGTSARLRIATPTGIDLAWPPGTTVEFQDYPALGYAEIVGGTAIADQVPPGISSYLPEVSAPSTPPSGYGVLYPKTDHHVYWKGSDGNEYDLTSGSGSISTINGTTNEVSAVTVLGTTTISLAGPHAYTTLLPIHGVVIANATSAPTVTVAGTDNQIFTGVTGADPIWTTITGDITLTGGATAIANSAVTYAKIQNTSAASVLIGRGAGSGAGVVQEITLGAGLSLSGTVLSSTGSGGTVTSVSGTTDEVAVATGTTTPVISLTGPHGFNTQTSHGVLLGQGTGAITATAAMTDGQLLVGQTSADPLPKSITGDVTFAASGASTIANKAVTLAKMDDMATASLIYRKTAGSGAPEVNTLATLKTDLGLSGTNSGDQTITLSGVISGTGTGAITTAIVSQTGTGSKIVVDTSPVLVTPNIGTPSAGTLTNCTGLPVAGLVGPSGGLGFSHLLQAPYSGAAPSWVGATGIGQVPYSKQTADIGLVPENTTTTKKFLTQTGTGTTGAAPAWGTIAGSDITALGTPTSGTLTNCTGYPASALVGTQVEAYASLDMSLVWYTTTVVHYNTEVTDTLNEFNPATWTFTPTTTGTYLVNCMATISGSATARRMISIFNGSTEVARICDGIIIAVGGTKIITLTGGVGYTIKVWADTTLTVLGGAFYTSLMIRRFY